MSLLIEPSVVVLNKGEGQVIDSPGRNKTTIKLTGKDSKGHYGLYEVELAPNSVTTPHIHHEMCEMFYVLDGEVDILAGERRVLGQQGAFVSVPPETIHAFRNAHERPSTFLLLFCPECNREKYFEEVTELMKSGAPNLKELREALDLRFDTVRTPHVTFP